MKYTWRGDRDHQVNIPTETPMMIQPKTNLVPDQSGPRLTTAAHLAGDRQGKVCDKYVTGVIKTTKEDFTSGTWNVQTLKGSEKLEILIKEMDRFTWNVVGIAELRWTGIGEITYKDGHKYGSVEKSESMKKVLEFFSTRIL